MTMNTIELIKRLKKFCGTTRYYKHLYPGRSPILLTEGCQYVRDELNAYWLFDTILKYQEELLKQDINYQIWELQRLKKDLSWLLTCKELPDVKPIIRHPIEFYDFPMDYIRIWIIGGVALLPSEY
jgi:hypothetical protein